MKSIGTWVALTTTLLIVCCLFLLTPAIVYYWDDESNRGTFGDQFGATNALFGGLALLLVAYSLIIQSRELKNQIKELNANAKSSEKSAIALRQQIETSSSLQKTSTLLQVFNEWTDHRIQSAQLMVRSHMESCRSIPLIEQESEMIEVIQREGTSYTEKYIPSYSTLVIISHLEKISRLWLAETIDHSEARFFFRDDLKWWLDRFIKPLCIADRKKIDGLTDGRLQLIETVLEDLTKSE
ncbi:hypothetical protein [Mucisphaera sp.]|uniref:hypothetical protein n=1 Tax=Mucisphaera sp. TaxID=2913024 RepID=UPI003D1142EC